MTTTPTDHEHMVQLHGIRNRANQTYWVLRSPETQANGGVQDR